MTNGEWQWTSEYEQAKEVEKELGRGKTEKRSKEDNEKKNI